MRRVLVTGATGFIGRHLMARLASDFEVVAAVRRSGEIRHAAKVACVGEVNRHTPWDDALGGVDAVVHLAAAVHTHGKRLTAIEQFRETNTHGTIALADACIRNRVKELVFLSSIAVNGTSTNRRMAFREDDPPQGRDAYAVSKYEAELGLKKIAAETGLACTIVRPPLVYGRGAKGNMALLARALAANAPLPLASIDNRRAFVSVGNLTGFIARRLSSPSRGAETFIVADEGHLSTPSFVSAFAGAIGRRPRLFRFPPGLLASSLRAVGRGTLVDSLLASLELDTSRARGAGWNPPNDTRTGLRQEFGSGEPADDRARAVDL